MIYSSSSHPRCIWLSDKYSSGVI